MLRVKYHENNNVPQNVKLKVPCTIINILQTGNNYNNIGQKILLNSTMNPCRSNKFLSIPERQRIIREINESKNQIDLHNNLYDTINKKKIEIKKNEKSQDCKNLLYIKKIKNDLNLIEKSSNKINNKNAKYKNQKIDIKFTDNRKFVNNAIKEYYKKMDNSFQNYLHSINNRVLDKRKNIPKMSNNYYNNIISNINNKNNKNIINNNNNIHDNQYNENIINIAINEIYKKPNLGKINNKVNNNKINEENNNQSNLYKKRNNSNTFINLDKLCIINSVRKEKINCTQMINNGLNKNIFNKINNYNTTTFRNFNNDINNNHNNMNKNIIKINLNVPNNNNKELLKKNYSSNNFVKKEILKKYNSSSNFIQNNFKRKNKINEIITAPEINIKKKIYKNENKFNKQNEEKKENKISINNNIKYTKKNIKSPVYIHNKKRFFKSNLISNDLPNIVLDKDIISIITYQNTKKNNNELLNANTDNNKILFFPKKEKIENGSKINKKEYYSQKLTLNEEMFKTKNNKNENKSLTFSFKESPYKAEKKNKTYSNISDKDEKENKRKKEKNKTYKNERFHNKYKNIYDSKATPILKNKNKFNYLNKKKNMEKDTIFNKAYKFYNSDDDIMNSFNNSNIDNKSNRSFEAFKRTNYNLQNMNSFRNSNIVNINNKKQMKEYFFNYFSNKINNDFLDENKFNKFENELLKRNTLNHQYSENINFFNKGDKNMTSLNSILSPNCQTILNSNIQRVKTKTITYDLSESNKKENNLNNMHLKNEISNRKKSPKKININLNNNKFEDGEENKNLKNIDNIDSNIIETNEIHLKNELKNENNEKKENNEVNENKNIVNQNEQLDRLSEIKSLYKFHSKEGGINQGENEIIIKEKNPIYKNKMNINQIELKNKEKKQGKEEKEKNEKINHEKILSEINVNYNENIEIENNNINDKIEAENNISINTNKDNNSINQNSEESIKNNFINTKYKNPISLEIIEYINIISPKNYLTVKNSILNLIINCEKNIESLFVDILYPIAINQRKYQPLYAKLFKDLDKYFNKKEKTKSIIRTQLMKFCKNNFKKIKICLEDINDIINDINFIGELIMVQMVSKKVGLQCLSHLEKNFNQYNIVEALKDKKEEKYLYLDCFINLLNKFATCVKIYQKVKIRQDELELFEKEINKNIIILKEILDNEANKDIPYYTKYNLMKLLNKSENFWEISVFEKYKNELFSFIFDEPNFDINSKSIKSFENIYSFDNKGFNNSIPNLDNKENYFGNNKQFKSVSPNSNNNINTFNSSKFNNRNQRFNSNRSNNNIQRVSKTLSGYTKIIENNLTLFKIHIDKYNTSDNFNDWNEIDNLFLNKKIRIFEIFKSLIEACNYFISNKKDIYYVDIYIKIILEYYNNYFSTNELNDIINALLKELSYLSDEILKKEENQFLSNIWIIIIYYLLQNNIIKMNDFNYFCKGYYNKEIKKNIFNILNGVCCYNFENKKYYLRELRNTKFANINKKIILEVQFDNNY